MCRAALAVSRAIGGTRDGQYLDPPFDYCTCVDRDGEGRIRTSYGLTNILAWIDDTDGEGGSPECGDDIGHALVGPHPATHAEQMEKPRISLDAARVRGHNVTGLRDSARPWFHDLGRTDLLERAASRATFAC